jgi:hypothetical protein
MTPLSVFLLYFGAFICVIVTRFAANNDSDPIMSLAPGLPAGKTDKTSKTHTCTNPDSVID